MAIETQPVCFLRQVINEGTAHAQFEQVNRELMQAVQELELDIMIEVQCPPLLKHSAVREQLFRILKNGVSLLPLARSSTTGDGTETMN